MRRAMSAKLRRSIERLAHVAVTLPLRRPTIEPQSEPAACGYVCISAAMALLGRPMLVEDIKRLTGTTARGLTLRQVRDGLRSCGVEADAIFFDRLRPDSYPAQGVVLLSRGHYVVIARRRKDRFEIYDPQSGWSWISRRKLARSCNGLAVEVRGLADSRVPVPRPERTGFLFPAIKTVLSGRAGRSVVAVFAVAQIVALTLPLLSMWSVDRSVSGLSIGIVGAIAIGFVTLSLTNILISLAGELIQGRARRIASVAIGRSTFDSLAQKPPYWFELNSPATLQNRIGSLNVQLDFSLEVVRAFGSLTVTLLVGMAALFFISPWLLIPGLCALLLSVILDLAFERSQRNQYASVVETIQRRQSFVLDTLSQLPLIARFDALAAARLKYASLVRSASALEARLGSLRGWRAALGAFGKSGETLFFVTLSAAFMAQGEFSIGGFVALGAYKDLLAGAMGSVFQLALRRRSLEVHRLQASGLLTGGRAGPLTRREVLRGDVLFSAVSFAYGSLDKPILDKLDLHARAGECTVIRGPSGTGKSTIARLLVGSLEPTGGSVTIDGLPLADCMTGMAAVLQSDRLILGTIRENILLFRRGAADEDIREALAAAAVDDFVFDLPMGWNTLVGEGAPGLSGGQRQRLLIARAILCRPRLIILDEATSSLEVEVEARILTGLRNSGATTLLIAHRPEVWARADRVYTLGFDGRFEEQEQASEPDRTQIIEDHLPFVAQPVSRS